MANPLARMMQLFVKSLPENATRTAADDPGLTIKTSPLLWPYEIFVLEWERRDLLRDLERMVKRDTRLDRANYVFGNAATRGGITVTIDSARTKGLQKRAQEVIDKMMKETKINAHLPGWGRTIIRDGDIFLNVIAEINPDGLTARIVRIKNLPAISIERIDDMTDNFPDIRRAFVQIDPINRTEIQAFPLWAINHIRWKYEPGERYGRSQYFSGREAWHKLQMTEQDLVVRRRTRAVQRRVHIIGNKDTPASEPEVNKYKALNALDDAKNAKVTTDYFNSGQGDVKNLEGDAHLDHIADVEYLLENVMLGTGVPLHILGFGRNVNRDIVEDQKQTYKEDVEGLQDLLENGDPGPFSGLRAIFNMALALQGINPEDVNMSIRWSQVDALTFTHRVGIVNQLRASQPTPMISRRLGVKILAKDLDLVDDNAVDDLLKEIDQEVQLDKQTQAIESQAVNPEKPNTTDVNRGTYAAAGVVTDSLTQSNPLHSGKMADLEKATADDVRQSFKKVAKTLCTEAFAKHLGQLLGASQTVEAQTDSDNSNSAVAPEILVGYVLHQFDAAWETDDNQLVNRLLTRYQQAADMAEDTLSDKVRVSVDFAMVSKDVQQVLKTQAGYRIAGVKETTRKEITNAINTVYSASGNVEDYQNAIRGAIEAPDWRIATIARTEMAYAFNTANLKYQMLAGYTTFEWSAVMDSRTCETCRNRNGKTFTITDMNPPPAHPNCRCIMIPVS